MQASVSLVSPVLANVYVSMLEGERETERDRERERERERGLSVWYLLF